MPLLHDLPLLHWKASGTLGGEEGTKILRRLQGGGVSIFYTHKKRNRSKQNIPFAQFPAALDAPFVWFAPAALISFGHPGGGGVPIFDSDSDGGYQILRWLRGGVCIFSMHLSWKGPPMRNSELSSKDREYREIMFIGLKRLSIAVIAFGLTFVISVCFVFLGGWVFCFITALQPLRVMSLGDWKHQLGKWMNYSLDQNRCRQ